MKDETLKVAVFFLGFVALSILAFMLSFMTPMSQDSPFAWHSQDALASIRVFIFAVQEFGYLVLLICIFLRRNTHEATPNANLLCERKVEKQW